MTGAAVDLTNIEDGDQLLSYAAVAQIERVKYTSEGQWTQEKIAPLLKKHRNPTNLSKKLHKPDDELLQNLDEVLIALNPDMDRAGGLSTLATRLRHRGLYVHIPPTWTREILQKPAKDDFDVLAQASALLSTCLAVPAYSDQVCSRHRAELDVLVRRLILIGASPPTPRSIDALIVLGGLGVHALEAVGRHLYQALRTMPLGFRVWRALTTIVRLTPDSRRRPAELKEWMRQQLDDAEELRQLSLYPARSLDLELAMAIPPEWSPPDDDWAGRALRRRAENPDATVRERGTAAVGLWQRSIRYERSGQDQVRTYLMGLNAKFRREAETKGGVAIGLRWIAETLNQTLQSEKLVCNDWPPAEEPCLQVVRDAVQPLQDQDASSENYLPDRIFDATKTLIEHALLQNAGVSRRRAIDTLQAGGWTRAVTTTMERVLKHELAEEWVKCRALFLLGFLQARDTSVERILRQACLHTKDVIDRSSNPTRGIIAQMHAALFAVGDCFGASGAEDAARKLRSDLNHTFSDLMRISRRQPSHYPLARALGYLITATAQTEDGTSRQHLVALGDHPDTATTRLSEWALKYRFDQLNNVRPLHAAI